MQKSFHKLSVYGTRPIHLYLGVVRILLTPLHSASFSILDLPHRSVELSTIHVELEPVRPRKYLLLESSTRCQLLSQL